MDSFEPSPIHDDRQREAKRLDREIPSTVFSDDVRRSLYRFALIRNSWGTTNIDAGPIDLSRVAQLYDAYTKGITPTGRILPTEVEVVNYFQLVDDLPAEPFAVSRDDLRLLHQQYFRDVPLQNQAKPGQWKTLDNEVAGPWGVLTTTPKEKVQEDTQTLLDWLHGPAQDLPTLVRAALFFHEFERIHPFGDGNGRAGRLATLLVLSIGGLPNVRYCPIDDAINEEREEYYRCLALADRGDKASWVDYFAGQVVAGYRRSHLLGEQLQAIPPRIGNDSRRFVEHLYIHKVRSFRPADTKAFFLTTARRTVVRRLGELEDLGLIHGSGRGAGRRYDVVSLSELRRQEKI